MKYVPARGGCASTSFLWVPGSSVVTLHYISMNIHPRKMRDIYLRSFVVCEFGGPSWCYWKALGE